MNHVLFIKNRHSLHSAGDPENTETVASLTMLIFTTDTSNSWLDGK